MISNRINIVYNQYWGSKMQFYVVDTWTYSIWLQGITREVFAIVDEWGKINWQ